MRKSLAFSVVAFVALMTAIAVSPNVALASTCNNKVCFQGVGTGNVCEASTGGPTTNCTGAGTNCLWETCNVT